ncbi:MAG: cell division protein ZapB [Pyrinomonadaceae bacterium]|nr:cell division protein ZapB [Acidobacteriota bacterium]MBK7935337.1 cell division protein ZapB [Acidobacteriota bacterium]MBP7377052.1 cell division protein ZapB [Pyrinomonadaceae bacterium]
MNALSGMEKFSHLEDKIYLTIQFAQKLREEKEEIARELNSLRQENESLAESNHQLETKLSVLLNERDVIHLKVEAMLDAMTAVDSDVAEAVGR